MKPVEHRLFVRALCEWIYTDESGRNAERVAEFVIAKAMSGHFAYFKLVIDLLEGKIRPTLEDELTSNPPRTDVLQVIQPRHSCNDLGRA